MQFPPGYRCRIGVLELQEPPADVVHAPHVGAVIRRVSVLVSRVGVQTVLEEQLGRALEALHGRHVEGRHARGRAGMAVTAGLDQESHQVVVAMLGGGVQGRESPGRADVDVGARSEQGGDASFIASVRRHMHGAEGWKKNYLFCPEIVMSDL